MDEQTQLLLERNEAADLTVELHAVTNRSEFVGNRWEVENVSLAT